jgi:ABC-2 type transport system permease protein
MKIWMRMMKKEVTIMTAIFKRELKAYFNSMTGYIFVAFLIFMTGIYTMAINFQSGYPNFEYVVSSMSFFYLLAVPVLTMKTISEERKEKTDQLLYALPLSMTQVVMGKFLAMATTLLIPSIWMCGIPLVLTKYGTVSLKVAYANILGFYLLGCALIAIGMFISSLSENQIVSAVATFFVFLVCYLISSLANYIPSTSNASFISFVIILIFCGLLLYIMTKSIVVSCGAVIVGVLALMGVYVKNSSVFEGLIQKVLDQFSLFERLDNFSNSIFDVTSLVYYIAVIALFIFLTVQAMDKRRWS